MGHILICTIGNRDVTLVNPERWPEHLRDPQPGERRPPPGARERGEFLCANLAALADEIRLPIIEKALEWIARRTPALDALILVSSAQPPTTKPEHRAKDTLAYAQVIKGYLAQHERWQRLIQAEQIEIDLVIERNPADFDIMREVYERKLPQIKDRYGADQTYYLALSGGTPAMTGMLLVVGSAVFGKTCTPLYIPDAERAAPVPLDFSRHIYRQSVRQAVLTALDGYNYAAAYKLLHDNLGEPIRVVNSYDEQQTIIALLLYAHQRLAFDFEAALATLDPARSLLLSAREQLSQLYDETAFMLDSDEAKLREVFFGAEIKYHNGEYADLLGRIFRFQEGALRLLAQRWGAQFTRDGKQLDRGWVASVPGLEEWLKQHDLKLNKQVNRYLLRRLAEFLAPTEADKHILEQIRKIERLATLRNQTVIAHSFHGVSQRVLAQEFTGRPDASADEADGIIETLRTICSSIQDQPISPNPFDAINQLLETLLKRES